MYNAVTDALS